MECEPVYHNTVVTAAIGRLQILNYKVPFNIYKKNLTNNMTAKQHKCKGQLNFLLIFQVYKHLHECFSFLQSIKSILIKGCRLWKLSLVYFLHHCALLANSYNKSICLGVKTAFTMNNSKNTKSCRIIQIKITFITVIPKMISREKTKNYNTQGQRSTRKKQPVNQVKITHTSGRLQNIQDNTQQYIVHKQTTSVGTHGRNNRPAWYIPFSSKCKIFPHFTRLSTSEHQNCLEVKIHTIENFQIP